MIDDDFDKLIERLQKIMIEDAVDYDSTLQLYRDEEGTIIDAVLYLRNNADKCDFAGHYFNRRRKEVNQDALKNLMIRLGRPAEAYDDSTPLRGS
jgi:hypothetical protein